MYHYSKTSEPNIYAFEKMTLQLLALTIKHKEEMLTFRETVNQRMAKNKKAKTTLSQGSNPG